MKDCSSVGIQISKIRSYEQPWYWKRSN
jgi:hypothetical protein